MFNSLVPLSGYKKSADLLASANRVTINDFKIIGKETKTYHKLSTHRHL